MQVHTDPESGRAYVVDPGTGESHWAPTAGAPTAVLPDPSPFWVDAGRPGRPGEAVFAQQTERVSPYAAHPVAAYPAAYAAEYPAAAYPVQYPQATYPSVEYPSAEYPSAEYPAAAYPAAVALDDRQHPFAYLGHVPPEPVDPAAAELAGRRRTALWMGGGVLAVLVVTAVALMAPESQQPVPLPITAISGPSLAPTSPARAMVPAPATSRARTARRTASPSETSAVAPVSASPSAAVSVSRRATPSPSTKASAPTSSRRATATPTPTRAQAPVPSPTAAPPVDVVRAGAFCGSVGARAVTASGLPVVCSTTNAFGIPYPNARSRWRTG